MASLEQVFFSAFLGVPTDVLDDVPLEEAYPVAVDELRGLDGE